MVAWKDTSSWSRGDSQEKRVTPKEWTLQIAGLRIVLHHYIGCGDAWFVSCADLRIERRKLAALDGDEAKREAGCFIAKHIRNLAAAIPALESAQ